MPTPPETNHPTSRRIDELVDRGTLTATDAERLRSLGFRDFSGCTHCMTAITAAEVQDFVNRRLRESGAAPSERAPFGRPFRADPILQDGMPCPRCGRHVNTSAIGSWSRVLPACVAMGLIQLTLIATSASRTDALVPLGDEFHTTTLIVCASLIPLAWWASRRAHQVRPNTSSNRSTMPMPYLPWFGIASTWAVAWFWGWAV